MNNFLIVTNSYNLFNEELNKISNNITNIINFNYDETTPGEIIEECNYTSLLDEDKLVIVKHFKTDALSKELIKYLENPNPRTKLVLNALEIDKRSAFYKKIKEKGKVIELGELKPSELSTKINNYCKTKNITIDYNAVNTLIMYSLNNYDLCLSEIDKLSVITNKITEDIINEYTPKLIGNENFDLCDAITSQNIKKIVPLLKDFRDTKSEVIPFVALLASQYRLIYITKTVNKSPETLAKELSVHPYRLKLAKEKAIKYTKEELEQILINICELDYNLKTSNIDPYILLENFIMHI